MTATQRDNDWTTDGELSSPSRHRIIVPVPANGSIKRGAAGNLGPSTDLLHEYEISQFALGNQF